MPETISYEKLYETLRREKTTTDLQKLDKEFYTSILKYLQEKSSLLETQRQKSSPFTSEIEASQKELENIKKIIQEIYERRETKIINLATLSTRIKTKDTIQQLLPEEKKLFAEIITLLSSFRQGILENLLSLTPPLTPKPKDEKESEDERQKSKDLKTDAQQQEVRMVRFVNPTPKFVANDLKIYGPFEEEDVSILPKKTANLLVKRNRAEEIKTEIKTDEAEEITEAE